MSTKPQQLEVPVNINFLLIVTGTSETSNAYIISQVLGILKCICQSVKYSILDHPAYGVVIS